MTEKMSPEEHLDFIYLVLQKMENQIELLVQQVALLNQRVIKLEKLVQEQPTWPLEDK